MAKLNELFDQSAQRNFWADRTDSELLELNLTTSDPEGLEGIRLETPPKAGVFVELGYNVSGRPEGRVRCVHCKWANHFHGVVVRDEDGHRYLVGRDCALTRYGVVYESLIVAYDAAVSRQTVLKRQRRIIELRKELFSYLRTLRADPALGTFDSVQRNLMMAIGPDNWIALCRVVRSGDGILRDLKRVRDYAAEERRVEQQPEPIKAKLRKSKGLGGMMPIFTMVENLGCRLRGEALFAEGMTVVAAFAGIEKRLVAVLNVLAQEDTRTRTINLAFVEMSHILKSIEEELQRLQSCKDFFEPENLRAVAHWCQSREQRWTRFSADDTALIVGASIDRATKVDLPSDYKVPGKRLVSLMREAVALQPKTAASAH